MPAKLDDYGRPLCWNCQRAIPGTEWHYACDLCDVKYYESPLGEAQLCGVRMWTDPEFIKEYRDDAVPDGYIDHGKYHVPCP